MTRSISPSSENSHAGFEVRGLDVRDETPFERERSRSSRSGISLGAGIGGDDDLLPGVIEIVEGVEELFLRPLLARDELDIVDEQEIDGPVLGAELRRAS